MRVLHLLGWYFPESVGGTEVYVAELARRQRAAGCRVAVAAPADARGGVGVYDWDGAAVHRYALADAAAGFARVLEHCRPEVVHVHSLGTGIGLAQVAAARAAARRVIFTAHLPSIGYICQRGTLLRWGTEVCDGRLDVARCSACALQNRGLPRPAAAALAAAGRLLGGSMASRVPGRLGTGLRMPAIIAANGDRQRTLLDLVDSFVALNQAALDIARLNGAPLHKLVLNPLGQSLCSPAAAPRRDAAASPVRVAFIGRLHEAKGLAVLVRALRALPASAAIEVLVYGPSAADAEARMAALLRRAAARDPRLAVRGALAHADVERTLRAIDVLCVPSTTFENGPTIAIEALAAGTPVIGSNAGGLRELIDDGVNGRLLPPGDWRALRDALGALAGDPAIVDRWRAALPRARGMDEVAADYLRLYEPAPVSA